MHAWKDSEQSVEIIGFSILFDDAWSYSKLGFLTGTSQIF